jgi:iron complex transport system substrate-binding protein
MKKKLIMLITLFLVILATTIGCQQNQTLGGESDTKTTLDMAGREVTVPVNIDKVYSTSAIGSVFLYTLAPAKLAGWNDKLRNVEKKFVAAQYQQLPVLGRWKGSHPTGSIEDLLEVNPDIIISVGDVSPEYSGDADEIESLTGIPVIMIDGSLQKTAEAYQFLGDLLDETKRAEKLAAYCDKTLKEIDANLKTIKDEEKIRVYYAEGMDGLETEISGTVNSEAFDLAGAKNVAMPAVDNVRRMQVSIEQVINWDPELIIISTDGDPNHAVYNKILTENIWANIEAVKNAEVYEIPCQPYDWINRPPSVVRFIGVKWLSSLLYPEAISTNIREDIVEFYSLFFDYDMTDQEIEDLLLTSRRKL